MTLDIFLDRGHQFRNTSKCTTADSFSRDLAKPAFYQVEPRCACRCKMQNETRMFFQPSLHVRVIVCSIIIQDHVNIQPFGDLPVNLSQEFQKFNVSMSGITGTDYFSLQDIQGSEKTGSAVTFVIVCHCLATSFFHRKARLCSVQGLDLRFLVHAQHHGLIRGVQVDTDNISKLFHKPLVPGQLESLHPVGLQTVRIPYPLHSNMADSLNLGHRSRRPVRRVLWGAVQGCFNNIVNFLDIKPPRTGSMRRIFGQSRRTLLTKTIRPQKNCRSRSVQYFSNGVVRYAICSEQADTGTQDNSLRRCFGTNPGSQNFSLLICHVQSIGWFPHALMNSTADRYCKDFTVTLH